MIKKPTVLILGAGASNPYGYPVGSGLKEEILNKIDFKINSRVNIFRKMFKTPGYRYFENILGDEFLENLETLINFRNSFEGSNRSSIDAFLENRDEFRKVGKLAIAGELIHCENFHKRNIGSNWNWFEYLHDSVMMKGCYSVEEYCENNKINIITFNYDRSFEHMLINALKETYGADENYCAKNIRNNIKIIHVHGQIDYLPWEKNDGREYGQIPASSNEWKNSTKNIKIIYENVERSFDDAHQLIDQADQIIFLGLNLHNSINLDHLRIKEFLKKKTIYTTSKGLTPSQKRYIKSYFNNNIQALDNMYNNSYLLLSHVIDF